MVDTGPCQLHAEGYNRPVRGQTGWNWSGRNDCFRLAPQEFGGIEFHADALIDCRWEPTLSLTIPAGLKSGVYAVKLTAEDGWPRNTRRSSFARQPEGARSACVIPTASYLAYANTQSAFDGALLQSITASTPIMQELDIEVYKNDVEFGLSTYDTHNDGAGVCYSSYHRPIVNMRPKYRSPGIGATWQFPADLSIVGWLEAMKYDYEVITDEDLHRDGVAALKPYRVVLNGTHNEYYSEPMMDATEDYLAGGGRLLYLGGNGYYWCVGFRDAEPLVMEVRKLEAGSRAWQARPGEHYLACTGERSGFGGIAAARRRSSSASASHRRAWTSPCRIAACRTAITARCPGSLPGSRARFRRFRTLRGGAAGSRSTATISRSARRRTRASWRRRSSSPTIIRWCRRRSTSCRPDLGGTQNALGACRPGIFHDTSRRGGVLYWLDRLGQRAALRQFQQRRLASDQERG